MQLSGVLYSLLLCDLPRPGKVGFLHKCPNVYIDSYIYSDH